MASPPGSPEIVYLWRRFVSARDAINYFKLDDPGLPQSVSDPRAALRDLRRAHRELIDRREALFARLREAVAEASKRPRSPELRRPLAAVRDQIASHSDECMKVIHQIWPIKQHLTRRERKEAGGEMLKALGQFPFDYPAAHLAIRTWCDESREGTQDRQAHETDDPRDLVRHQLLEVIDPLLVAYEDPHRFFVELLPEIEFWNFTEEQFRGVWHLGTRTDGRPVWPFTDLAELIHRWGYGVLLNPDIRAVFDKAALEPSFSLVLAQAEGKTAFLDVGPPLKVDYDALRREYAEIPSGKGARARWKSAKGKELGVKPSTIDRYLRPSFGKRP